MKNCFIILGFWALLVYAGCTGNGRPSDGSMGEKPRVTQPSDTLYSEKAALSIYGTQPKRALQIIDTAELLGNLTETHADFLRAMVYSRAVESLQYDSAILIAERLMLKEEVQADTDFKRSVLEVLLNACRMKNDNLQGLHWATELSNLYRERGEKTEALRIDAEIGGLLVSIGQQEEGLGRIDSVILRLVALPKTFNNLDASIIALKRKEEACREVGLYSEMISTAQRIMDLLSDYELHPAGFHDGSPHEPNDERRPQYIDFYRGKAYAYMAIAYASLHDDTEAQKYVSLYDQTFASQSLSGRLMIAPTLGMLGEYERMQAIYDETEQSLGNDTLNDYYAEVLFKRADIAEAQNRLADANHYLHHYIDLKEQIHKDFMNDMAHLYAARYQVQQQQREIERQREATRQAQRSRTVIGFIALVILLIAIMAIGQAHKTRKRNRILVQQISEAVDYKEKYDKLRHSLEADGSKDLKEPAHDSQIANQDEPKETAPDSTPAHQQLSTLSDAELFDYLRNLIERELLFLDPSFERQTLIDRTGLSKERIGAAFAHASDYERMTALVRELRLDHAVRLLNEKPELTIEQVCMASGFSNTVSFNRSFKAKYGMTPSGFRETKA